LEAQTFLARAAIAVAKNERSSARRELAVARRVIDRLRDVPCAWARANAACLRAGLASVEHDQVATVRALRAGLAALDEAGMPLMRALATHALGRTLGGDEGAIHVREAATHFRAWRVDRDVALACTLPGRF
jgi:hypothetical protein